MTSRDFCYWLQGFFEVASMADGNKPEVSGLTASQISMIRNHLNLVFVHEIDPSMGDQKHQQILTATHHGTMPGGLVARC